MTKKAYDFQFTERDGEIIAALARYRFLKTSQIRRLIFRENTSPQSAQRRLRYLDSGGYIKRIQPPFKGDGKTDKVCMLDKAGAAYARHAGFEFPTYGMFRETSLPFLNHALGVSEFRLQLELACQDQPLVRLHRFISDFELKTGQRNLRGQNRFRLFDELTDPASGESITFYPDAVVILAGRGEHKDRKRLYFVEIDRGTETHRVLARKLHAYELARKANLAAKFGVNSAFRVLFQFPSENRCARVQEHFASHPLGSDLWFTSEPHVKAGHLLTDPIWQDVTGTHRAILKSSS